MSDESIYGLIPVEMPQPTKSSRFKSRGAPPPTASTFGFHGTSVVLGNVAGGPKDLSVHPPKKATATFGKIVSQTISPKQFILKGSSSAGKHIFQHEARVAHPKKPHIPSRDEKPVMGLKTAKNFVVANAVENILSMPKRQIAASSLRAVDRDEYGKVPGYIGKIKEELSAQYKLVDEINVRRAQEAERFHALSAEEHQSLKSALQHRWETLNKEFQTMGFSVETYSQKKHQEEVESELRRVEAALLKLSKDQVYVYDD
jgi:hypothetical protein